LNQCLHNLDALQWLCGMPARVRGFCQLGHYHNIEVEDNVTAYLEYQNGARVFSSPQPAKRPAPTAWKSPARGGESCWKWTSLISSRTKSR